MAGDGACSARNKIITELCDALGSFIFRDNESEKRHAAWHEPRYHLVHFRQAEVIILFWVYGRCTTQRLPLPFLSSPDTAATIRFRLSTRNRAEQVGSRRRACSAYIHPLITLRVQDLLPVQLQHPYRFKILHSRLYWRPSWL
ncbi:hypothetical protein J6590_067640 [Homalodisca vitripennis]|nr:hypothetical protein J6590_067640 [Homalodisca vitripennis]